MSRVRFLTALASAMLLGNAALAANPKNAHVRPPQRDQEDFVRLVDSGKSKEAFEEAFEEGEELFETKFIGEDGAGANVGKGQRFTRAPRADLDGPGEWANHFPSRVTGPNAQACTECHAGPDDAGGPASANVSRDPLHTGDPGKFINRNTPHLFALGALQRLAEEMNADLEAIRAKAIDKAKDKGEDVKLSLVSKGVSFGKIIAHKNGTVSTDEVKGVDPNLVVKPFQWKGSVAFLRDFSRGALHNELGIQAVELVGKNQDGDFDGVVNELSVGDQTALVLYNAAQPRPTTKTELVSHELYPPMDPAEVAAIAAGSQVFDAIGCATCHVRSLTLNKPIFSEPSKNPNYRDAIFPAGGNPLAFGLDPKKPITFDLTADQPDNQIVDELGRLLYHLGALEKNPDGSAIVRLFSDLKRHDMGDGLKESIKDDGVNASQFLTRTLWGVGSTAPYMHDGRATTLGEAILEHGGEGAPSRSKFKALSDASQEALIAFLSEQVLYKAEEEGE
jgi:hypothetical protein